MTKYLELNNVASMTQSSDQEFGVLRSSKSQPGWWQRQKLRLPPYRWYLSSSLRQQFDELRNARRRIAYSARELPYREGIPVHCPELFSRWDLKNSYLWHCSDCIKGLARLLPGWGSIDTLVAAQAFHAGSIFGALASKDTQGATQRDRNPIQFASVKSIPNFSRGWQNEHRRTRN